MRSGALMSSILHAPGRVARVAALVAALGCSDPFSASGRLAVEATATTYRPGDSFTLRLENVGRELLWLGVCPAGLYPVTPEAPPLFFMDACPAMAMELPPGDTQTISWRLPNDVPPGRYRIGYAVASEVARSQVIEVRE